MKIKSLYSTLISEMRWAREESRKRIIDFSKTKRKRKPWNGGDAANHDAGRFRVLDRESATCPNRGRSLTDWANIICYRDTWCTASWGSFLLAVTAKIIFWCMFRHVAWFYDTKLLCVFTTLPLLVGTKNVIYIV